MTFRYHTPTRALTSLLIVAAIIATFVNVRIASAHVTVTPAVVRPNVYQTFVVDVPTEKTVPTITVRIEIPAGLRVSRFQPKPGWTRTVEKDPSGLIVGVTWTGGSIAPDEYEEFVFLARTPKEPGPLIFKAHQTYEGGEVVGWTGGELDNFPASIVQVTDEAPAGGIDQENPQIEEPEAAATGETAGTEEATTATAGTPADATATAAEATSTAAPATSTPAPSATIAALPSVTSIPSPPPAGIATAMDSGSDLGLFVGLAALVVASIGTAVALVALVRRRGAS